MRPTPVGSPPSRHQFDTRGTTITSLTTTRTRVRHRITAVLATLLTVSGCAATVTETPTTTDRLVAALERTLIDNPVRATETSADGRITERQTDRPRRAAYMTVTEPGASTPSKTMCIRGDDVFLRPGQTPSRTWVRLPSTHTAHKAAMESLDSSLIRDVVATARTVTDNGNDPVNGVPATRFTVIADPVRATDAVLDSMPEELPEPSSNEVAILRGKVPRTTEFWVDRQGWLVKTAHSNTTTFYRDHGAPFEAPVIDEPGR